MSGNEIATIASSTKVQNETISLQVQMEYWSSLTNTPFPLMMKIHFLIENICRHVACAFYSLNKRDLAQQIFNFQIITVIEVWKLHAALDSR